jgi:hypothetical protein
MNAFFGLIVGLILTKALIEPLAARIGRRYIPSAVARVLNILDPFMPRLMAELSSSELETVVRAQLEKLTGESWKVDGQLQQFFEVFDPRVSASKAEKNKLAIPREIQRLIDEIPNLLNRDQDWYSTWSSSVEAPSAYTNDWDGLISAAIEAGAKFPECVAAQWALESGWGEHTSGRHNYFGLKGPGTSTTTREFLDGQWVRFSFARCVR